MNFPFEHTRTHTLHNHMERSCMTMTRKKKLKFPRETTAGLSLRTDESTAASLHMNLCVNPEEDESIVLELQDLLSDIEIEI